MPLKIDSLIAGSVNTSQISLNSTMVEVDNTINYPTSTVFSSFNKTGVVSKPIGTFNIYSLKSDLNMVEVTDLYSVALGVVNSPTQVEVTNIKGTFNNVPFLGVVSTPYSLGALVEDAESPGDTYNILFAGVDVVQVSNEYLLVAVFFTQNAGENFIANVDLEVELMSQTEITFSNIIE